MRNFKNFPENLTLQKTQLSIIYGGKKEKTSESVTKGNCTTTTTDVKKKNGDTDIKSIDITCTC